VDDAYAIREAAELSMAGQSTGLLRVIVADDDADTREIVAMALQSRATEIHLVTNGAELLEQTRDRGPFDVIVTDINMPIMDGLEAVTALRALGIDTPVLVITAHVPSDTIALSNVILLRKPFDVSALRSAVDRLLAGDA
jgi:CheY-like chemotaxis protein